MKTITIKLPGSKDYKMIRELSTRLGWLIIEHDKKKSVNGKKMVRSLEKLASLGGVKSIPDPVAWQREIRKDRKLPLRNE